MSGPLAVVLSGGGARGAFQVGALEELMTNRGVDFDIFCGVSTGAIQALGGAQNDIPGLKDVWLSLRRNSDVYRKKFFGVLGVVFGADSIYNASPIHKLIVDFADEQKLQASGKKLMLGVVNLQNGEFRNIHENTGRIGDWVYASCAMPFFFQPLKDSGGGQWVDGGVRNITPLDEAFSMKPRGVLVIMASPMKKDSEPSKDYDNLVSIGLRSVGILTNEVFENDIGHAGLINSFLDARKSQAERLRNAGVTGEAFREVMEPIDLLTARYQFAPVEFIAPEHEVAETLEFDPDNILAGMEAGRRAVASAWSKIEKLVS